jgi:hypothetical protein
MMPRLLVDEDDIRLVHSVDEHGRDVFTLERREEDDAMGDPRWSPVALSSAIVRSLYRYILKTALEAEDAANKRNEGTGKVSQAV